MATAPIREFAAGFDGWNKKAIACTCACCYRVTAPTFACPDCAGSRVEPDALNYLIDGKNIAEISAMSVNWGTC